MEKNVGDLDAYFRITCGLTLLGIGVIGSSKLLSFLGSMKVAEGITRFCPLLYFLDMNTLNWELKTKNKEAEANNGGQPAEA